MKKNCAQTLELLKSGYLDNELEPSEREEINLHLAECPACRSAKENLEAIGLLLRNASRANPPENLWARIQKEIASKRVLRIKPAKDFSLTNFKYFFTKRNSFALAAAAALVLMVAGFYVVNIRTNNGETALSLTALAGNDETRESNMDFGSSIEKYLL